MCLLWTVLNAILIVHYLIDGKLTEEVGISLLALLPALVLGIVAGSSYTTGLMSCYSRK